MKITESLIKSLIREEIENVTEMFGRNEDLPLPDDPRAALIKKTINGLQNIGPGAAARSDENIIAAIAELVADLGGTLPDASTMEEGMYNKDPRPCADDERYKPPSRNDYRQFGKCVKK
tara:strand:+ start:312 stop:668 length:357 start_codon:yes stop_codon:yes gene_type:complete